MLYAHAGLCASAVGGKMPEIWEVFPLWSQKNVLHMKAEKVKAMLLRQAQMQHKEVIPE